MARQKAGGSFAIAGFVFQFLNSVDLGLAASFSRTDDDEPILVLEPDHADAASRGAKPKVIQYKIRSTRDWTTRAVLFEILPPLLRAALADPEIGYSPCFVTTGSVPGGVALRALLADLGAGKPAAPLKVGHAMMTADAVLAGIAARTAISTQEAQDPIFLETVRALLARVSIKDGVNAKSVRTRVMAQLHRATGSRRRAERAYAALFTFIAEQSQQPAALITARAFLDAAELTTEQLASILSFERNLADLTGDALSRRGYSRHMDVRRHLALPDASLVLIEGASGSGKTWSLAHLAARALAQGHAALWVDEIANLEALESEVVSQLWHMLLRRSERDGTSLSSLAGDVAELLGREAPLPLLVALDRLPRSVAERERLLRFDWGRAGIRLLAAVNAEEAADIQAKIAAPVLNVGDFSQAELKDLLGRFGIAWPSLPASLRGWIKRPVLAGLYSSLAAESGQWSGASEFELMERFADRAEQRGNAAGIFGCRALIAALGGVALAHPPPLAPHKLTPRPTKEQLRILIETGWLQLDASGHIAFAHDRLRDWAIAEHLVGAIGDPAKLAGRLATISGFGKEGCTPPIFEAGHALMDGIWQLARGSGGTERLGAFLEAIDQGDWSWQLPDVLYGDLLPDGGPQLFDRLLPILEQRLLKDEDGQPQYHAVRCMDGFVRAGRVSPKAVASLLWSENRQAQIYGCRFAARQPERRYLERIAQLHKEADSNRSDDSDVWALSRTAWKALRRCLAKQPGWLAARIGRAEGRYGDIAHLISLLPDIAEGRAIWAEKGEALVAALGEDPHARYWLARAIEAFEDRRFDPALADWSCSTKDMAAIPAWTALCRHRPDLVAEIAPRLPQGLFAWNSGRWLQPLFAPQARPALRIVLDTLKAQDPSGCTFAFALAHFANNLDARDIEWAAERLDAALGVSTDRDLTTSRLLDLFMEIDDPALLERLPSLLPDTLPARLLSLAEDKLETDSLWHDPELDGAVTLLQRLGGAHAVAVTRAQLRAKHPTIRWMSVRKAAFADIALLRPELEAIANAGEGEKEPGRLDAVHLLATHDPQWGHARVRQKLEEGTSSARNEAFWLAIRLGGDDYVAEGLALLPQIFTGEYPLFRLVEYLIPRRAGHEEIAQILSAALPTRKKNRAWIVNRLLSLDLAVADDIVLNVVVPKADMMEQAELAFWGLSNRPDEQQWRDLAEGLIARHETRTLRHARGFNQAAARLGRGPAHDQLLSDAYPADPSEWDRALQAIRALAANDEAGAAEALTRLCGLMAADDRDLERFASMAGRSGFADAQLAVLRGGAHWPAEALWRALASPKAGHAPQLIAAVTRDLQSPDPAMRRAAAIASPLVLGLDPIALIEDREESVRQAVRAATDFHAQRQRVQGLLADMAGASPDRARRAAAALFSLAERAKPNRSSTAFSWSEFADVAPEGSGFLMAMPH